MSRPKVEVFLVVDGRRWQVYDWAEVSGHKYPRHHGQHAIEFRGFVWQIGVTGIAVNSLLRQGE